MFAAAISRFAAMLDLLLRADRLHEPEIFRIVIDSLKDGVFRGAVPGLFTMAYFHLPQELADEVTEAGFELPTLFNVEGPGSLLHDFQSRWADPVKRENLLEVARLVESRPEFLAAASHLLAVSRLQRT
jgi:hypothetical protein